MEPGLLSSIRESVIPYYQVRVPSSSEELLKQLEELLRKPSKLYDNGGRPLPRLHVDKHLFSPLLLNPEDYQMEGVSVSPPGLRKEEAKFLRDLSEFWKGHHREEPYGNLEVYLLRNLPRVGVGFFRRSGFYPAFILWIKDKKKKITQVQFIDPHGLHHGGLSGTGNRKRIEALKELKEISKQTPFRKKKMTMSEYLLTQTKLDEIPDVGDLSEGRSFESVSTLLARSEAEREPAARPSTSHRKANRNK